MRKPITNNDAHLYVVGNGPSLKDLDFDTLASKHWLGMNAAYRHWEKIGLYPRYYSCFDRVVGQSHCEQICDMVMRADELGIEAFMLDDDIVESDPRLSSSNRVHKASKLLLGEPALKDRVTTGSHSVVWAVALGYETITLLGIDQNYSEDVFGMSSRGGSVIEVTVENDSPNYYFKDYQRLGDKLNRPNPLPNVHASAWRRVMHHIVTAHPNVTVINASPLSRIPGTIDQNLTTESLQKKQITQNTKIVIPHNRSLEQVLNALLPIRFLEIEDKSKRLGRMGRTWKIVDAENASNRGRWHLKIRTEKTRTPAAELGSFLQFFPNENAKNLSDNAGLDLLYDQLTYIWDNRETSQHPIALLALRSDSIDPVSYQKKIQRNTKIQSFETGTQRFLWRLFRLLDVFRSNRT